MSKSDKRGNPERRGPAAGSDLAAAAEALEQELQRFEELTVAARRVPLSSQKNLDRAARATRDAAENQEKVAVHLQALVAAITAARDRHQASAEAITARAQEIRERSAALDALAQRFAELGREATAINEKVQGVGPLRDDAPPARVAEVSTALGEIHEGMGRVVEGASALRADADAAGFEDMARQCDAMRQQVHSARNKVELLRKAILARAASA